MPRPTFSKEQLAWINAAFYGTRADETEPEVVVLETVSVVVCTLMLADLYYNSRPCLTC